MPPSGPIRNGTVGGFGVVALLIASEPISSQIFNSFASAEKHRQRRVCGLVIGLCQLAGAVRRHQGGVSGVAAKECALAAASRNHGQSRGYFSRRRRWTATERRAALKAVIAG